MVDPSPREQADAARGEALAAIEEAAEIDDVAERVAREQEAIGELADAVAQALADGMNQPVGAYAGPIADLSGYFTKTDVKQLIKDRAESLRGGGGQPLERYVDDRLEGVTIYRTTDAKQGAEYRFNFGNFQVTTTSGGDGRGHYNWDHFKKLIAEAGGETPGRPAKNLRDPEEWEDFIDGVLNEIAETKYITGPRTEGLNKLKNIVINTTGYGTPEGALDYGGVWVIHERQDIPGWWGAGQPFAYERWNAAGYYPEWWAGFAKPPGRRSERYPPDWYGNGGNPTPLDERRDLLGELVKEVRVHESDVVRIVDEVDDLTRAGFYQELHARNLTIPGMSGVSVEKWVNGGNERFWAFLPELATPRTYIPDPDGATGSAPAPATDGQRQAQVWNVEPVNEELPAESPTPKVATADGGSTDDGDGFDTVGDIE